jgi:hypothetical protein
MDNELTVRLNSLEKRLKDCEAPATLMYCRPGSDEHETLVEFLNDTYIQLQELKWQVNQLLMSRQQILEERAHVILHHLY